MKLNMKEHNGPGLLITFCGLDGCGKSTTIDRIISTLSPDHSILLTKQPTDFVRTSAIFRTYMDSPNHDAYDYRSLSLLAASDRIQHSNKVIAPAIQQGKIVLSDRYFYSCLANLRARGFKQDKWIYEIAGSIVKPDIAFFLDIPVEEAIRRVRSRPEEKGRYIDVDLQHRLRQEYINICKKNNGVLISTLQSPEETYRTVINHIRSYLEVKSGNEDNNLQHS